MPQICFYFQLHQPYRLRDLAIFDIGEGTEYFRGEDDRNKEIFRKVSHKSYIPMLKLLLHLTQEVPGFRCALSCSGIFLEQAQEYEPRVISLLQNITKTGKVEFLAETYYHSLASLYSPKEFRAQVQLHAKCMNELFGIEPTVFRNTELIYSNDIAAQVAQLGFRGMLTEAVDRHLHGRSKTRLYRSAGNESLPLLLKHAEFSDDIAFRFSDKNWQEYPLTVEKYLSWLSDYYDEEIINLFMDFETFGEHQWQDTGIFTFFEKFVTEFSKSKHNQFVTPTEVITSVTSNSQLVTSEESLFKKIVTLFSLKKRLEASNQKLEVDDLPIYDVPEPISWADVDRDVSAWIENPLQQDTLKQIYNLESIIKNETLRINKTASERNTVEVQKLITTEYQLTIIDIWRKLQTSDHFYYMCTKWAADGDVHAYFSPYNSPYDAYTNYCIALADLKELVVKEPHE